MSKGPKIPESVEVVAGAATAAATAGIALTALPAAGIAVVPAMASGLVGVALQTYGKSLERKASSWLQLVSDLMDLGTPEETAQVIEEEIRQPWAHKSVVEGIRAILNDIDDVALPALAKIVARRLMSRRPTDRRDKRAIELLCDCEPETYAALEKLVMLCEEHAVGSRLLLTARPPKGDTQDELTLRKAAPTYEESLIYKGEPPTGWQRAFFLLRKHEFGGEGQSGPFSSGSGPEVVAIATAEILYLHEVLCWGAKVG